MVDSTSSDAGMRVVALPDFGQPPHLRLLPVPAPGNGEIRVRVHAASVNGFDVAVANGLLKGMMEHRFPVVLGKDFAGVVDAAGPGTSGFRTGHRVFGVVTKQYLGDGSFGEFVTVPAAVGVAQLPKKISFETAAALGLAGTTARLAVEALGALHSRTLLISGATGGIGSIAVQIATARGANVIATSHGAEADQLLKTLRAAQIVDFTRDIGEQVQAGHPAGVDAVLHLAATPAV